MKLIPQLEAPLPRYIWGLCQADERKWAQFKKNSPLIVQHKYQTNKHASKPDIWYSIAEHTFGNYLPHSYWQACTRLYYQLTLSHVLRLVCNSPREPITMLGHHVSVAGKSNLSRIVKGPFRASTENKQQCSLWTSASSLHIAAPV